MTCGKFSAHHLRSYGLLLHSVCHPCGVLSSHVGGSQRVFLTYSHYDQVALPPFAQRTK